MRAKKFLSILLALMLVISVIPTSALADEADGDTAPETVEVSPTEPGEEPEEPDEETTEPTEPEEPDSEPVVLAAEDVVAKIGEQGYATIAAAIEEAEAGATIEVVASTAEDVVIPEDAKLTLDLADGVTLTNVEIKNNHTIFNKGDLTITGSGTVDNVSHGRGALYNTVGATAVLNGGTYIRSRENGQSAENNGGNSWYAIKNFGTMTINDGVEVRFDGKYSSLLANGWQNYSNAQAGTNGEPTPAAEAVLTINGGTFSGGLNTVKNDDYAKLTINDGKFINVAQHAVMNWNVATINGGTFETQGEKSSAAVWCGYANDTYNQGQLTITGGTFETGNGAPSVQKEYTGATVKVTGGTFSSNITAFIPKDVALTWDEETGEVVADTENVVAEVGGVSYRTLAAAIAKAQNGDTVKLLKNTEISEDDEIKIDKDLTIDLNGCTVSGTGNQVFYITSGTVEIKNGEIEGETKGILCHGGTVTLTNVQITAGEHPIHMLGNVVMTVDQASVITSEEESGIYLNGSQDGKPELHVCGTVIGGRFTDEDGLWISPAIQSASNSKGADVYIYSGAVIQSGAENPSEGDAIEYSSPGKLVITGGDISGNLNVDEDLQEDNISVSGGSFSSKVEQKYCAKGFVPTEADADGKYTVTPNAEENAATVTKDGVTTVYKTLSDAITAAKDGDTIALLQDVTTDSKITNLPEGVTLDGQNHKLTLTENVISKSGGVFDILKNNVTIKDLTIDAGTNAKYGVQFYGNITGTLDNVTINGGTFAAVNVNGADVTIEDSTLNPNVDAGAYANIDYSMGSNVTTVPKVTVTGTITYDETKPLVHADQDAMKGVINKTSDGDLTPKEKSDALTEIAKNVTVEGQKMVLAEDGKVVSKKDYKASELKTDIASKKFIAGSDEWVEFTFTTVANDDAGVWVYGGSDFGKTYEDKIAGLEYQAGEQWIDMKGKNFGGSGFPMTDATSTFRVKFTADAAGAYTFTASMKRSDDDTELCNVAVKFTVSEKSAPVTPSTPTGGSHHSSSSSVTTYPVTVDSAKHGTVTASAKNASRGTTVTITVKADDGYELDGLTVTDKDGKTIKVTEGKNGKFTFTMPASKVTIEAGFAKSEETPDQRFTDVPEGYWAEDEINWAADNGYMNGNTATTFNPEGSVTRQQLWMILARLSSYQPADFAEAKAWAVDNGISDGSNPANAVTRQQLVTILYRYAVRMGYKTTGTADLTAFPDHASVADYAKDAMSWSVANGIVGGTSAGTLNPTGTATRAQFAVILYRFCEKVVG